MDLNTMDAIHDLKIQIFDAEQYLDNVDDVNVKIILKNLLNCVTLLYSLIIEENQSCNCMNSLED